MRHEKQVGLQRQRRGFRVRNRIKRDATHPRLCVFRSHKHMYAQIIDDEAGRTLAAASTKDEQLRQQLRYGGNKDAAAAVGKAVAERPCRPASSRSCSIAANTSITAALPLWPMPPARPVCSCKVIALIDCHCESLGITYVERTVNTR